MADDLNKLIGATGRFGGGSCRVTEAWETETAAFIRIEGQERKATMTVTAAVQHRVLDSGAVAPRLLAIGEAKRKAQLAAGWAVTRPTWAIGGKRRELPVGAELD